PISFGASIFYFFRRGTVLTQSKTPPVTPVSLEISTIRDVLQEAYGDLAIRLPPSQLADEVSAGLYNGATRREIAEAMILAARSHIEQDPRLSFVAARLLLNLIYSEVLGEDASFRQAEMVYTRCFERYFEVGIAAE